MRRVLFGCHGIPLPLGRENETFSVSRHSEEYNTREEHESLPGESRWQHHTRQHCLFQTSTLPAGAGRVIVAHMIGTGILRRKESLTSIEQACDDRRLANLLQSLFAPLSSAWHQNILDRAGNFRPDLFRESLALDKRL